MNVLFWNLKQNPNEKWVADLTREKDVDIAVFAEYQGTSFEYVLSALQDYVRYDGYGACEKITMLCKQSIETTVKREQNRYTLYSCKVDDVSYNIVGIHLPAPQHDDANDRKNVIRDIVHDISEQEREEKNELTIIIGDFNCNPFDEEIIQKDTFNAVLYKPLIRKKEEVLYNGRRWRRFYNPVIHYLSEDTGTYGSFYYSSNSAPLYWNSFDQVLVRKELIDDISCFQYIRQINGKTLIKETKPNNSISDHLPLFVCFTKGE